MAGFVESLLPGIPYPTLMDALLYLLVSIVAAKGIDLSLRLLARRVASRTRTSLDDLVLGAIERPIVLGGVLVGLYLASKTWDVVLPYVQFTHMAFMAAFIAYGAYMAIRVINAFVEWYMTEVAARTRTKKDEQFIPIIRKALYGFVGLLAFLWILSQFGIEVTTLVAALGIGGLAIALALQDTLKEFFAGTYMIVDRPVRIGDFIELETGEKGYVEDIGWRSTRLKMLGDNLIIIPNSRLASSKIVNYAAPFEELSVVVPVGVSYLSDLDKVEKVTIGVARRIQKTVKGAVETHEPFIRYNEFADSNINFSVILRARTYVDRYLVIHEFMKALKREYDRKGIEISWPVRKVYVAKGKAK
jgi:small-conductance mechanosensitive channel